MAQKILNGVHISGTIELDFMPGHQSEGIITLGRFDDNTSRYHNIKSYLSSTEASNYLKFSLHAGTENAIVDVLTLKGNKDAILAGNVILGTGKSLYLSGTSGLRLLHDGSNAHIINGGTGDLNFKNDASNKDIFFSGLDGSSTITALTLDMSEGGNATFSGTIGATNFSGSSSGTNTGDQDLRLSDTFDYFEDSSAVSLHQFNNSMTEFNGNYNATSVGASFGTGVNSKFGTHGLNTQGDGVYVDIAGLPTIQAVSIWYKAVGGDNGYIVDFRHDAPGNGRGYLYTLAGSDQYINRTNDTTFSGNVGDIYINGVAFTGTSSYQFTSGNWYHIVITTNNTSTGQTWDQGIRIGNRSDGSTNGNAGYFDQVRTFNRRLVLADVKALYAEVETGATADQTAGEILSLIDGNYVLSTGGTFTGDVNITNGAVNGTSFASNRLLRLQNTSTTDGSRMGITFQGNASIGSGLAWIEGVNDDQSAGHTSIRMSTYNGSWHSDAFVLGANGNATFNNSLDLNATFKWATNQSSSYTYSAADASGMYIERVSTAGAGSAKADIRLQARDNNSGGYTSLSIKGSNATVNLNAATTHVSGNLQVKGAAGATIINGTGGTTSKLLFKTTDNNDESAFIHKEAYWMRLSAHQNEGFKFTDTTNSTILLQLNGGAQSGGNGINSATFLGSVNVKSARIDWNSATSATATTMVANVLKATYSAVFFDFLIKNGTNVRAGTVTAAYDGTNVEFTETSTVDLGDTSDVTLSVLVGNSTIFLQAVSTSSTWTIKSLIRAL